MSLHSEIEKIGKQAKDAAYYMASASPTAKTRAIKYLAELIHTHRDSLLKSNEKDVLAAKAKGMDSARCDRLTLTPSIITEMIEACHHISELPDPIGAMEEQRQQANGLLIGRMRIPLGVIAMIYEARPNVTIDSAILCLKAGNAIILRGGSEAINSNTFLAKLLSLALEHENLPPAAAQLLKSTDRAAITYLCKLDQYIDVIIPRGGENLVKVVTENATMPVLKHFKGVCHVFVDKSADLNISAEIAYNSKVQRPAACNCLECLLIHADIADDFMPLLFEKLNIADMKLKACPKSFDLLKKIAAANGLTLNVEILPLEAQDLGKEFHCLTLAIKIVDDITQALEHIKEYNSQHTDVICTDNYTNAQRFIREVDASMVGVNASTRFNDGGQLGLGAEIGISTSKLHAFGPMGVKELTTTKFVVQGNGQIRT